MYLPDKPPGVRFGKGEGVWAVGRTGTPDFDRLVIRSRGDLGSVGREVNRRDGFTVGVGLLALELQRACVG